MGLVRGLSTLRTDKKPRKYRSAEEKRQHLEYLKWREELLASLQPAPKKSKPSTPKQSNIVVRDTPQYPSLVDNGPITGTAKPSPVYNGERKLLGIATLHKSVMQPVFDAEYAKDVARMRRG